MYNYLICVATVNGPRRLEEFLISIREHTSSELNYAISIADDCSDEALSQANYQLAVKYKCFYHRNSTRSGVPYSWNRAASLSDSEHVVIANDDVLFVPGWLTAYDKFVKQNETLDLGVIAWPATNILEHLKFDKKFTVSVDEAHIAQPVVACSGYLFACPRKLFAKVGGFDERYFATWEEIDFGAKLCMNGLKSVGINGPVVYHQGGASFSDPINQHPALKGMGLAQTQWIDKWAHILNIKRGKKIDSTMIKEISKALIDKIPKYSVESFKDVLVEVD